MFLLVRVDRKLFHHKKNKLDPHVEELKPQEEPQMIRVLDYTVSIQVISSLSGAIINNQWSWRTPINTYQFLSEFLNYTVSIKRTSPTNTLRFKQKNTYQYLSVSSNIWYFANNIPQISKQSKHLTTQISLTCKSV